LGESDAKKPRADLEALWSAHNRGGDELTVVSSEYLEVIAGKPEVLSPRRESLHDKET